MGGGSFLGSWKKNIDEDHGELVVWIPTNFMPKAFWAHPIFAVIEVQGDELKVVPRLWGCHEAQIMRKLKNRATKQEEFVASAALQRWREDNGQAQHPPDLCPYCILPGVIARLVEDGKIGFADVVFEWVGDKSTTQVLAGGIYGQFRNRNLTREQDVAMRKAGVKKTDAFKHDLKTNMKYMFVIVDDKNPDKGLLTTIESEGFGNKNKAAILSERKNIAVKNRFTDDNDPRLMKSPLRDLWDPSIAPYAFAWSWDNTKDEAQAKGSVVAVHGMNMTDQIKELVMSPELPDLLAIEPGLEPGNCYELRAELEAHCKVSLPWDEIFGPAEKAGLMKPPSESKEEVQEKPAGRTPEITTKQDVPKDGPITIGPDHLVWKNKAYKPGQEFKGREVLVLPPKDATDADVSRVIALFKSVATAVGEHVLCEHCNGEMTTFDPSCSHCGAEYMEDGKLATRPCVNPLCTEQVDLVEQFDKESGNWICAKCATIQHIGELGAWVAVEHETPKPVQSARRRRSA